MKTLSYDPLYLFIDGRWLDAEGRDTVAVVNPATNAVLGRLPLADASDLDRALAAAERGFATWRRTAPAERARILKASADLMRERVEHIATLMTLEEGKPLVESRDEVLRAADYFEWFAEEARRIDGRVVPANRPGVLQLVQREPTGPVAAFTPRPPDGELLARQILVRIGKSLQRIPAEGALALGILQFLGLRGRERESDDGNARQ